MRMKGVNKGILGLLIVIIIAIGGISYWSITGLIIEPNNLDDFAKCLTEKGVVMYGTEWCSVCKIQKEMFNDSFQYINYVECTQNQELCQQMDVTKIPAWLIDGEIYQGKKTLEELSNLSGCLLK